MPLVAPPLPTTESTESAETAENALSPLPSPLGQVLRRTNWYLLIPLMTMLLFASAMGVILWTLHTRELQQQQDALQRDLAWLQQKTRLSLLNQQDQLLLFARDIGKNPYNETTQQITAQALLRDNQEIAFVTWLDPERRPHWALPETSSFTARLQESTDKPLEAAIRSTFELARRTHRPAFTPLLHDAWQRPHLIFALPIFRNNEYLGILATVYSLDNLLRHQVPDELTKHYKFTITDNQHHLLSHTTSQELHPGSPYAEFALEPLPTGFNLGATAFPPRSNLANNMLLWLVIGLSCLVLWSLWSLWRHIYRRFEAQQALLAETAFRRAMENSMTVGMRALDMEGRIIYVNPAFCRMTGWESSELVGQTPPFSYWAQNDYADMQRFLDMTLSGRAPLAGYEVRLQHRGGTLFYARMYVAPLIDGSGKQTGWISSMTDITEPKRVREELTAAHERFMTVLESLEAAVSVLAPDKGELLFANRYYQLLFDDSARGHLELSGADLDEMQRSSDAVDFVDGLAGLPAAALIRHTSDAREVFLPSQNKWFEVRRRYIQWVDGYLAQMIIATDITSRRMAEDMARQHEERLQFTSRLTTMGEMASSLAHELNQPLAAINNYCMGAVARIKSGRSMDEILPALEKASAQAVRAGTIIQRIRSFVKRSEPQRREVSLYDIVDDAVGLAEIEAIRRGIRIVKDLPSYLPHIFVDPVLIEQVLVNLLKNAAEAMQDHALMVPDSMILIAVHLTEDINGQDIAIEVRDQGPGIHLANPEQLFEPFYSTKAEGMGMGLNICRSIIESHHGRLWVDNNTDGPGCTFKIRLPIKPILTT